MLRYFRASLRNSLIAAIAVGAVVAAGAVGLLAYQTSEDALVYSTLEKMHSIAQAEENHIVTVITMRWWQLEELASMSFVRELAVEGARRDADLKELQHISQGSKLGQLYIANKTGTIVAASNTARVGESIANRAWFTTALGKPTVGDMRKDGDGAIFRVTVPIRDAKTGEVVAILGGDSKAIRIYNLLTDSEGMGKSGESYLIDSKGMFLSPSRFVADAHFDLKNTAGAYQAAIVRGEQAGGIWDDYRGEPVVGYAMFDGLEELGLDWVLVVEMDEAEALASAYTLRNTIAVIAFAIALIMMVVGYLIARSISTPVANLAGVATSIGEGDLSVEVQPSGRIDEVGALENAFHAMSTGLREIIGNMQSGVAELTTSASQISATARQTAATAAEQASTVAEVSTTTDEITQTSRAVSESAEVVVQASEQAYEQGQQGLEATDNAVQMMQVIRERVEGVASKILQLSEQNGQIGDIVDSVNDLAEQSNLLAVNASIEAAKAGEQGLGFAVVASEVRSLAEQSKRAAQQIRGILREIQKATESAVMATEEGNKRVADGQQAIEAVRTVVEQLGQVLEDNSDKARQIAGAANQQASGISQISEAMTGVAQAGEESSSGAKQLEQAAMNISSMSEQLEKLTRRYRL